MKDQEFECLRCGTVVSINSIRCPRCGLDFYLKDELPQAETEPSEDEPEDIFYTSSSHSLYAPWIQETESALILVQFAWQRMKWSKAIETSMGILLITLFLTFMALKTASILFSILAGLIFIPPAIYNLLYPFFGKETITVERETITVHCGIWIFKRAQKYQANKVKALRCADTTYYHGVRFGPKARTVWEKVLDTRTSAIVCEYDGQKVSLLGWIKKPLARHFVSLVKRRFSNYRQNGD